MYTAARRLQAHVERTDTLSTISRDCEWYNPHRRHTSTQTLRVRVGIHEVRAGVTQMALPCGGLGKFLIRAGSRGCRQGVETCGWELLFMYAYGAITDGAITRGVCEEATG